MRRKAKNFRPPWMPLATALLLGSAWSCQQPATQAVPTQEDIPVEDLPEIEDIELWLTGFHRNPDPERIPMAMVQFSDGGMFEGAGHAATAFFAEVFRLYPGRVEDWMESARDLPEDHRHWLCISVWWSQCTHWEGILESFRPAAGEAFEASLVAYLGRTPQPILETELSPSILDGLWVSYFASGNPAYVERITTALVLDHGEEDGIENLMVYGAAGWSLASNVRQHEDVKAIVVQVHAESTGILKDELTEILSNAP